MKIDIDLNKIKDLSKDVKDSLRSQQKDILFLNKKIKSRDSLIEDLRTELDTKNHEMKELLRLKAILQEFFSLGQS